jgi:hypothetical protein
MGGYPVKNEPGAGSQQRGVSLTTGVGAGEAMAVIVVGGSGHGVGKTALVCGLIRALAEMEWTAIKITSHDYGQGAQIWEESAAGEGTDTSRYLAAGARRALLVTAADDELEDAVRQTLTRCAGPSGAGLPSGIIFESNRVLKFVDPDLCLGVEGAPGMERKASYGRVEARADALVRRAERDGTIEGPSPVFELADLERLSERMREWVRAKLG